MLPYDLPTLKVKSQASQRVVRHYSRKGKVLRFWAWQTTTLALLLGTLTYLRYRGLLAPLAEIVRSALHL